MPNGKEFSSGFTFVELLVVLLLMGLLAGIAAPMVTGSVQRAKESTLKEDLFILRKAIDGYYADKGEYPKEFMELVDSRYIREVPVDPMTGRSDSWILVRDENAEAGSGGILDVHSGSNGKTGEGVPYQSW